MGASNWVHLDFLEIERETDKAFLIRFHTGRRVRREWFPFSQVADYEDYKEGDKNGTISITEWISREKRIKTDG